MPSVTRSVGQTRLIKTFDFTVAASTTEDYVYLPVSQFKNTIFFVEIVDSVDDRSRAFIVNTAKLSTDDPKDTLFAKVGEGIAYTFNVVKIATDIVLSVTNNDSNTLNVNVIRIAA